MNVLVCGPLYRANRCLWEVKVVEVRSPVWKVPCAEYRWDTFSFVHGNLVCLEARDQGAECDTGDIHGIMAVGTARSGVSERGSRKCSPWIRLSCYCDVLKSASDFKTNLGASFERVTENKNMSPPQHSRLQGRIQHRIRASFRDGIVTGLTQVFIHSQGVKLHWMCCRKQPSSHRRSRTYCKWPKST